MKKKRKNKKVKCCRRDIAGAGAAGGSCGNSADACASAGRTDPKSSSRPQKHVPREMDYAFEPDEQEMCFDIENLDEKDDFDLL